MTDCPSLMLVPEDFLTVSVGVKRGLDLVLWLIEDRRAVCYGSRDLKGSLVHASYILWTLYLPYYHVQWPQTTENVSLGSPLIYQSSSWICQRSLDEECERCSSQSSHLAKTISLLSPTLPEGKTVTKTGLAGPWGQAFTTLLLAVGSPRLWPETADVWGCHRQ